MSSKSAERNSDRITLAGCWVHVYRRFDDAEPDFPLTALMKGWIQDLYRIDAKATMVEERARFRRTESAAVLHKMKAWMTEQRAPE